MRLTMRMLLNWINQNLSEEDGALIAQKVEESELAKTLKNQIEAVMRLERLPAPSVLDGTPRGNANSTAEYLDNSMQSDKTPEYEKFCIHSEIVLGEVASCHQILSRVIKEKVEISPELRTRLVGLYQFIGTDNEYSPISVREPEEKETVDFTEVEALTEEAEDSSAQDAADTESEPVNYWKYSTFALLGLWFLWFILGLALPKSIPGRMLSAIWEKPGQAVSDTAAGEDSQNAVSSDLQSGQEGNVKGNVKGSERVSPNKESESGQ